MNKFLFIITIFHFCFINVKAQETIVTGKILDANSGDSIPFANVFFLGTQTGATSDFDGFYKLKINVPVDSIVVSYIGYNRKSKPVNTAKNQVINFST
ncbi:MAG: carboxypeptidase-like regulatory domain-containing protein [Bacteroidota bacterium]|nr:carboxypeptidase-like regulatory domain-containing protein [Bacteroidota bacterium]